MSYSSSSYSGYSRFVFLLMGVIFLVVGLGLFFGLGDISYAGGAMKLTGGIFAIVGGILVVGGVMAGRSATRTNTILQTGIPGTAQITGLTQTGMYLNEQPQIRMNLLITLPGEVPYAATHQEFVPLMLLGRLSTGAPLSVRVDQMDRSKVVIDWNATGFNAPMQAAMQAPTIGQAMPAAVAGMPAAGAASAAQMDETLAQVQAALAGTGGMAVANPFSFAGQENLTVEQLRAWLRQNGLEATGHVDQLEDTNKTVGDEREFKVQLTLSIPGQAPQTLTPSVAMVPVAVAHKLYQGMTVPVRYAAQNHNLLMVEWDKV